MGGELGRGRRVGCGFTHWVREGHRNWLPAVPQSDRPSQLQAANSENHDLTETSKDSQTLMPEV